MGLPKLQNPYGGSYKIPGSYRKDSDTVATDQKFTSSRGMGSIGKVTGNSVTGNSPRSSGSAGGTGSTGDTKNWMAEGVNALNAKSSPQFQTVGLGAQTFGKVF